LCDPTLSRSPRVSRRQPRRRPAADPDNGRIEMTARSLFLISRLIEEVDDRFATFCRRLGWADQLHHLLQRMADARRCSRWIDGIDACHFMFQPASNAVVHARIPKRRVQITKPLEERTRW